MKRKLLALVFVLAFAITSFAALGVSGVSADPGVTLEVGILSPQGSMDVVGPGPATGGAITAFTNVTNAGVEIENIEVTFD